MLGWRLLHEGALAGWSVLGPLLPRPAPELDRDPIALALAALATALALVYLLAVLAGASTRARLALVAAGGILLVAVPTAAFVAMGIASGRPYGQDGGVVQLPLAIDRILSGHSPYGADYTASMLGRQARVSDFWTEHGGNPILHHHAYLPGTHLLMLPLMPLTRALLGTFDPRVVTLLAFAVAGVLAYRLPERREHGLAAAAAVWLSPLVYWQQIFGANDVLVAALLLAVVHLARSGRDRLAAAVLGLACATKQLAWPFAPFLLAHLSGARSLRELLVAPSRGRLLRAAAVAGAVFVVVVLPVAALDPRAFWQDIVVYNAGLPGGDNYPLGGTPGLGLANLLVYFGAVSGLRDYVPLGWLYLLIVPLGLWLLRAALRRGLAVDALAGGGGALLLSLYVSRVFHPNYLILAAVLLPAAVAAGASLALDALLGSLLLLATAVEIAESEALATTWADAVAARWPAAGHSLVAVLAPRAGADLTRDPLGLLFTAIASGLAVALVVAGLVRARPPWRAVAITVAVAAVLVAPTLIVMRVGRLSGTPRVADGWAATVWPRTAAAPPPLREAWSRSFRKDPPAEVAPSPGAPAAPALARAMAALGGHDPRPLVLAALAVAFAVLAWAAPGGVGLVRLAATMLLPATVVGVIFGAGDVLLLALVLISAFLAARHRAQAGAFLLGLATSVFPRLLPAAPLLAVAGSGLDGSRPRWRVLLALAAGIAFGWGAALAAGGTLPAAVLGPGLGLSNLRLYAGATPGAPDGISLLLLAAITVAATLLALRTVRPPLWLAGAGAAALLATLWVSPSASPSDVVTPVALLGLAATSRHGVAVDRPSGSRD